MLLNDYFIIFNQLQIQSATNSLKKGILTPGLLDRAVLESEMMFALIFELFNALLI